MSTTAISLKVDASGRGEILLDGADISADVRNVTLYAGVDHAPAYAVLEYACTEWKADGDLRIYHRCPIGGRA